MSGDMVERVKAALKDELQSQAAYQSVAIDDMRLSEANGLDLLARAAIAAMQGAVGQDEPLSMSRLQMLDHFLARGIALSADDIEDLRGLIRSMPVSYPHPTPEPDVEVVERAFRAEMASKIRAHCTPSTEAYERGGDYIVSEVADWVENPPEWVAFDTPEPDAEVVERATRAALARWQEMADDCDMAKRGPDSIATYSLEDMVGQLVVAALTQKGVGQ